jgi:hypothetical protein
MNHDNTHTTNPGQLVLFRSHPAEFSPPLVTADLPLKLDSLPAFSLTPNPNLADLCDSTHPPKNVPTPPHTAICAGKNTYVYDAHTYHTKVPPQGIRLILEHYTDPGDTVLDPFCGSGMTGVAAVESGRRPILVDLSPAATFIAYNLLTPAPPTEYAAAVRAMLEASASLEAKLYATQCPSCHASTSSLYTVWSYTVACYSCGHEFQLWDEARDERPRSRDSKILTEFACPSCGVILHKRRLAKIARHPVLIGSGHCKKHNKESTAAPTEAESKWIESLSYSDIPESLWYPTNPFPDGVNTKQPIAAGIRSVHQAYTPRALWAMAHLWHIASRWPDPHMRAKLLFTLTSLYKRVTVFSEFRFWGGSGNTANYSVPFIMNEQNVFRAFERKANTIRWYFESAPHADRSFRLGAQSACHLPQIPDRSVDFIFTDPPFGANINYSEMNFLWESWLQAHTDPTEEAIVSRPQGKTVDDYSQLLAQAFREMRRVLKDGAWLVVVFHNSSDKVWRALQQALTEAGFAVKATQTFDKRHGTFKQFVSDNAVGYDLVLHCRKAHPHSVSIPAQPTPYVPSPTDFVSAALSANPHSYLVHYLHVSRPDEIDYRHLYADWLSTIVASQQVGIDFEEFRAIVAPLAESARTQPVSPLHTSPQQESDHT